jgi:very-short-patch-repair endonuclease
MPTETERGHSYWHAAPALWEKLKPLAREKRHEPTPAEDKLWQRLRNRQVGGVKFRRQYSIERFIVDFFSVKQRLAIEVDGSVHDYTVEEDALRQKFIEGLDIQVLRFSNQEVIDDVDGVIEQIATVLKDGC